ncbi:MAG: hypothetical protein AAGJ95_12715 [Cyanobacteria bacterium J06554_11]
MSHPKPLPELHITEMFDGNNPVEHVIQIADIDEHGITIGRVGDIKICVGLPPVVWENVSRRQATIYAVSNPNRQEKDIYLRCGYRGQDGGWTYSGIQETPGRMKGTGVWLGAGPISPDVPMQLRPGTFIKVVPKIANYQCILEWGTYPANGSGSSNPPTVPMGAADRDQLYFENRTLKEQAAVKDIQIETLQDVSRRQRTLAEEFQFQTKQLSAQIKKERDINAAQDKKIAKIRVMGAIAVVAVLFSLGIDVEQVDKILEIIAVLSTGGLIWAGLEKPKTS